MSQKHLNCPQIDAAFDEVGGEAVAERVTANPAANNAEPAPRGEYDLK
jgi:hypothetical protein